jgi:hypothetical protein
VEEDEGEDFGLTIDMKSVLEERMKEDEKDYLAGGKSIELLNKKYGV